MLDAVAKYNITVIAITFYGLAEVLKFVESSGDMLGGAGRWREREKLGGGERETEKSGVCILDVGSSRLLQCVILGYFLHRNAEPWHQEVGPCYGDLRHSSW